MNISDGHPVHAHHKESDGIIAERRAYLQSLLNIQKARLRAKTRSRTLASILVSSAAVVAGVVVNMKNSWEEMSAGIAVGILVAMVLPTISFIASYWEETVANRRLQRGMEALIKEMEHGAGEESEPVQTMEQKIAIQTLILTEHLTSRFGKALREGGSKPS